MAGPIRERTALDVLATRAIDGEPLGRAEALGVLGTPEEMLLDLVAAAARVRRHYFADRVRLHFLVNMKSGLCPEDCSYCSQRRGSSADVATYAWANADEVADVCDRAVAAGVRRVCLVASGRGPSERDVARVAQTISAIRKRRPGVEVCACLGLLRDGQGEMLRDAGVLAYNHNLNVAEDRYPEICTTHSFADRKGTLERARRAGLSPCSGVIFGLGEDDAEVVDLLFALRAEEPDSVPVNFLIPFDGTPAHERWDLTPLRCLKILALCRLAFPATDVRIGGGREIHLRALQPLALHLATSIFLGDYLTSEGAPAAGDLAMIADAGFVVEGLDGTGVPTPTAGTVALRRRGIGTGKPANV